MVENVAAGELGSCLDCGPWGLDTRLYIKPSEGIRTCTHALKEVLDRKPREEEQRVSTNRYDHTLCR